MLGGSEEEAAAAERAHTPAEEPADGEDEKRAFKRELMELFRAQLAAPSDGAKFLFSPCWDSKKQQITSFACDIGGPATDPGSVDSKVAFPQAETACRLDVTLLAVATAGVRHITARGDVLRTRCIPRSRCCGTMQSSSRSVIAAPMVVASCPCPV